MADKNKFELKAALPVSWEASLDEAGFPQVRFTDVPNKPIYSLVDLHEKAAVEALILEDLNGKGQYKRGREEIFASLLIAQAYRQGQIEPSGPIDLYEQACVLVRGACSERQRLYATRE